MTQYNDARVLLAWLCWLFGCMYGYMEGECAVCGADHTVYDGNVLTRLFRKRGWVQ